MREELANGLAGARGLQTQLKELKRREEELRATNAILAAKLSTPAGLSDGMPPSTTATETTSTAAATTTADVASGGGEDGKVGVCFCFCFFFVT